MDEQRALVVAEGAVGNACGGLFCDELGGCEGVFCDGVEQPAWWAEVGTWHRHPDREGAFRCLWCCSLNCDGCDHARPYPAGDAEAEDDLPF